jgi:hypothetical protein
VMRFIGRLTVIVVLIALPSDMRAQAWRLGVDAGRIRSNLDPVARQSETLLVSAGYDDRSAALRLSAGIPTPADSMRWAAIGVWKRFSVKRNGFTTGIDLSGNAFAYQLKQSVSQPVDDIFDPLRSRTSAAPAATAGRAVAAEVLPIVGVERGILHLQARGGMSYYDASTTAATSDRVVGIAELQLLVQPSPAFALAPVVRRVAPRGEKAATFAGGIWAFSGGRLKLAGSIGRWIGGIDQGVGDASAWSLGGELRVAPRTSITASARHTGVDPMYRTPAQTSWSIGASFLLRQRPTPSQPVAVRDRNGVATIRLPVSTSSSPPRVAGDFNNWTPSPMERDGTGWRYTLTARPGVYNYAFVAPDGTWFVPDDVPGRKSDGMGGHVAVLVIR